MIYKREPVKTNKDGSLSCVGSVNGRLFIVDGENLAVVNAGIAVQKVRTAAAATYKSVMENKA